MNDPENSARCQEIIREANESISKAIEIARDMVSSPPHYNKGKIEVLEFLEDQDLPPHEWNVVKYVCRARWKSSELEDLKKARFYLDRKIHLLTAKKDGFDPLKPNQMKRREE